MYGLSESSGVQEASGDVVVEVVVPDVLRKCGLVRRRGNDFSRLIA